MKRALLDALLTARDGRTPCALVTDLDTGAQALLLPHDTLGDLPLSAAEHAAVLNRLNSGQGGCLEAADTRPLFVDPHPPPPRMIVVGAVHIAQHLVPMAVRLGYDVCVVDPRETFATAERFPGVRLHDDWPDDALAAIGLDAATAVITLTHDPKLDDPALRLALPSAAFYVGALGSPRTHAKRVARLHEAGLVEDAINRLHAPVGLDIGARGPAEIALAILAEVTAIRRGAAGR